MASNATEDHYRVLGIDRSASAEEIKAAYRKQVLLHHPDRAAAKASAGTPSTEEDGQIQRINAAYDTLNDAQARVKYDFDRFGTSMSPDLGKDVAHPHGSYKAMTGQDVDDMFSGLNTYERFTTAKYHALRSSKAPSAIGRRATNFNERKQFRASQLPTKNASLAWLGFPVVVVALWAFNLKSVKDSAKKAHRL